MPPARAFAEAWVAAWNRHDVEAVLGWFAEDVLFTSPLLMRIDPASAGAVRGKAALRDYWTMALAKVPNLHFDLLWVAEGVDLIAIGFRNEQGVDRCEILRFADGLVAEGHGTYPAN